MARARLGVILGALSAGAFLATGLADCADPTQIEIDVRTDGCSVVRNTGIAVTSPERVDDADLTIFTPRTAGCEAKPEDRIGTLVIYPSGAKDAEVAVRIVTGVTRNAQDCAKGPYDGCIVARRVVRFVPGTSQKVIVIMSRACEGKDCGRGAECTQGGQCVTVLPDGGTSDAGVLEAAAPDAGRDAAGDGPSDAGRDACVDCQGPGMTCTGGTTCAIDCAQADCEDKTMCAPGLDCSFACSGSEACSGTRCVTNAGCSFACTSSSACKDIACSSDRCTVACNGGQACNGVIHLSGGDAGMTCTGGNSCNGAEAYCDAGRCALSCNEQGGGANCPDPRKCAPGSTCTGKWN